MRKQCGWQKTGFDLAADGINFYAEPEEGEAVKKARV